MTQYFGGTCTCKFGLERKKRLFIIHNVYFMSLCSICITEIDICGNNFVKTFS